MSCTTWPKRGRRHWPSGRYNIYIYIYIRISTDTLRAVECVGVPPQPLPAYGAELAQTPWWVPSGTRRKPGRTGKSTPPPLRYKGRRWVLKKLPTINHQKSENSKIHTKSSKSTQSEPKAMIIMLSACPFSLLFHVNSRAAETT